MWGHSGADGCGSCSWRSCGGSQAGTHSATTEPGGRNRTCEVALGGDPVPEPRRGRVTTKLPKHGMRSIPGTPLPVLPVDPYFAPQFERSRGAAPERHRARWRSFSARPAKWLRLDRRVAPTKELDGRMRRSQQSRDRRDLDGRERWNPDRDLNLSSEFPKDHCPSAMKITDSMLPLDSPIGCRFCRGSSPGIQNLGEMTEKARAG